jgi:hypothetical protein
MNHNILIFTLLVVEYCFYLVVKFIDYFNFTIHTSTWMETSKYMRYNTLLLVVECCFYLVVKFIDYFNFTIHTSTWMETSKYMRYKASMNYGVKIYGSMHKSSFLQIFIKKLESSGVIERLYNHPVQGGRRSIPPIRNVGMCLELRKF